MEKRINYQATNSYSTLNTLTEETKNVWFVCHGLGHLSRFFLKNFEELPKKENYIIAPQAPSKYYLSSAYTLVGASWLTKEATSHEITNVLNYMDAVYATENIGNHYNLIVLGFSQGVSVATRWVASRKIKCEQLVLYAGGLPNELTSEDFDFLIGITRVTVLVGDKDQYLNEERLKTEKRKIASLFQGSAIQRIFEGGHEIRKDILESLV